MNKKLSCTDVITGAAKPINKTKADLEQLIKANGGTIVATQSNPETICIAEGSKCKHN